MYECTAWFSMRRPFWILFTHSKISMHIHMYMHTSAFEYGFTGISGLLDTFCSTLCTKGAAHTVTSIASSWSYSTPVKLHVEMTLTFACRYMYNWSNCIYNLLYLDLQIVNTQEKNCGIKLLHFVRQHALQCGTQLPPVSPTTSTTCHQYHLPPVPPATNNLYVLTTNISIVKSWL